MASSPPPGGDDLHGLERAGPGTRIEQDVRAAADQHRRGPVPLGVWDGRALTRDLEHAVDRRAASAEQAPVAARRAGPPSRDRHPALALLDGPGALSRLPL